MHRFFTTLSTVALTCIAGYANAATIIDTTVGTATRDGTINSGEYVGSTAGINDGFGNVIGSSSTLSVDSSISGTLNFGLSTGGGAFNDVIVIYIDSISGGFNNLTSLNDQNDGARRAISGRNSGDTADLTFASGFDADYAITIESGFSGLFLLAAGGNNSLAFQSSVATSSGSNVRELELSLSDLGLSAGDSFDYVVTYISNTAFRSNEFHGAPSQAGTSNAGFSAVVLSSSDFNTFTSVPEPTVPLLAGLGGLVLTGFRRKREAE